MRYIERGNWEVREERRYYPTHHGAKPEDTGSFNKHIKAYALENKNFAETVCSHLSLARLRCPWAALKQRNNEADEAVDKPACHFHGDHLRVLMHWGWHSLGEFESSQTLSPGWES